MRIVVTGASGFLGGAICRLAGESGYTVTAIVRKLPAPAQATPVVVADLLHRESLTAVFRGASAVVHAAGLAHAFGRLAQDEAAFQAVNVRGTEAVVDAAIAAGVPRLVLISSVSVYGGRGGDVCDETAPAQPATPYARSKRESELCAGRFNPYGQLTTLRFATIYGEGDRGNVSRLIRLLERRLFVWPGSGINRKSLIYKDDAALACLAVLRQPGVGVYNVSDEPATMREIVSAICEALGRPLPRAGIPAWLIEAVRASSARIPPLRPIDQAIQKFVRDDIYVAGKFRDTFHFSPQVTLREGIQRQVRSKLA